MGKWLHYIIIFVSEFFGTALLVFLGCLGCVENIWFFNTHMQQAINFGLAILICVQCFGCVSGAHINPAITLAAAVYELVPWKMIWVYFLAQILGSLVGYGTLYIVLPKEAIEKPNSPSNLCVTAPGPHIQAWQACIIEFIITAVLVLSLCSCLDPRNPTHLSSIAIRLGIVFVGLSIAAGSFTGASMNPARSFGPALWHMDWDYQWVYWAGPLPTGLIVALGYKYFFERYQFDTDPDDN